MTLLDRDPNAPAAWHGNLPVSSRYTYGLAGERFFRAIRDEGRITGTICKKCDHTYVPAVQFCEKCLAELSAWVDAGTVGELHTYTILYESYDGSHLDEPEVVAFVRFGDGGLIHRVREIEPEELYFGMPLEAVFKPKSQRVGSILDIEFFRPAS